MAKQKKRRLKKKYRVLRGIYAAVVAVAAVIVIGYGVYKVAVPAPEMKPAAANATQEEEVAPGMEQGSHTRREQTYTFLLACPDQVSGNADAIMLVTYDVPNQKIGMLSVPRDTLVDESSPKINSSLHGGIENLQDVVSDLVGYPIDFYITIDLDGFVELVDAVGGVEFDVPVEMYYSDPTQDLNIFFQPGMQHLDGQAAMEVCRFRKNGDGTGYPLGLTYSTSQREQPLASTTGRASWAVKSVILDIITSPRPMGAAIQIEVVQTRDRSPPPEKGAGPVQFIKERAGQAPLYLTYILKSCLL